MPAESPKARLWLDGCFDGFHFAHANAVRQSRKFGDYVIVGVHSDRVIEKNKGPTLFDERTISFVDADGSTKLRKACSNVPYITDMDYVAKYNIDYVCHGDDPVLDANGRDCYENAKKAGKYKEYPRTDGISTTSLIDRILMPETRLLAPEEALWKLINEFSAACPEPPPIIDLSDPNNRHDTLPRDNSRDVVYIGASWDAFGSGHVEFLRRAHQTRKNAYLIVGVWGEQTTWDECGERPLLDTLERVLAVLQCRYTSAVIIDAPAEPTAVFLSEITAKFVVNPGDNFAVTNDIQAIPNLLTIEQLRERVKDRKDLYSARQKKKRT
ncbi:ethanolamine-phosphate cytidylyltransferase [Rhizoctonia solani AG-3 Rhs1AP]|uniref:ethanolamine-phosphate cytidylyltransferase n=1 Tax=Rhizoctonia solani AG-3 Rhs1AP TaxID=1086054 RepID=X8JEA5_9AGAM|nr:ethanolamine-phosphate cytidylyltransferase [Rhizoctonia solani AG-3 Rhs1AP]